MARHRQGKQRTGPCKLTGTTGPYVRSHLIPKALTRPAQRGMPFLQLRPDGPPLRRWSSWYDPELVTRAGEDILEALDSWAIEELRRHKLVWSSWGTNRSLGELHEPIVGTAWGVRRVDGIDPGRLRMFFLSLLWRAAATRVPEFSEVQLSTEELEQLRTMVCDGNAEPRALYPIQLTQLSTMGIVHNHAPLSDLKILPNLTGGKPRAIPIFRFYFDGLIAHFHSPSAGADFATGAENLIVGMEPTLLVSTQTYEGSLQGNRVASIIAAQSAAGQMKNKK
jgi:hypothetical protein